MERKKRASSKNAEPKHSNRVVAATKQPILGQRQRIVTKLKKSTKLERQENNRRCETRRVVASMMGALGEAPNFIQVKVARPRLEAYALDLSSIGGTEYAYKTQMLEEAVIKGTEVLYFLFDSAPLVSFKDILSSGILRELTRIIVSATTEEDDTKHLKLLAGRAEFGIKHIYSQLNRIQCDQFTWSTTALQELMQWTELNPVAPPEMLEAFLGTFELKPDVSAYKPPSLQQITLGDITKQLRKLETAMSRIEEDAISICEDIVIRFRLDGLEYCGARLKYLVGKLLLEPEGVMIGHKTHFSELISTLATHSDCLPSLHEIFANAPTFLWMFRRMTVTRRPLQDATKREGTSKNIEKVYRAMHPRKDEVQLVAPESIQNCTKDVLEYQAPLHSETIQLYYDDFIDKDKNLSQKNPYPVDNGRILKAAMAIALLYQRALDGITSQEKKYSILELCRDAENEMELLEHNRDLDPKRLLKIGEKTLLPQLLHNWNLIPEQKNQNLYERIMVLSRRVERLARFWKLTYQTQKGKEKEKADKTSGQRTVGKTLNTESPSSAGPSKPTEK